MFLLNFNISKKYKVVIRLLILLLQSIIFQNIMLCNNNIEFYFQNKKLLDLVFEIAKARKINIILPQLKSQIEELNKRTVTYKPQEGFIDLKKAWNLLEFFISMSGYALIKADGDIDAYEIILNNVSREPLDLYVNVDPNELPNSTEVILYIAYLKNIKIDQNQSGANSSSGLDQIFKSMLSPKAQQPIYLKDLNGYVFADRADIVASIQAIISQLDQEGFQEAIEVIDINYVPASSVVKVLNILQEAVKPKAELPSFIAANQTIDQISHFAANLKIITDPRQNNLIIMGRRGAVAVVSEFIRNRIDQPGESGKSVLHFYDLQYLDAKDFEIVLQNVVNPVSSKKQGAEAKPEHGSFRYFRGVIVKAEQNIQLNPLDNPFDAEIKAADAKSNETFKGITAEVFSGGNRILVLALDDDWKEIKALINKLDQPNPQILIDALIMDINISKTRSLASTTRTMTETSFLPSPNTQFLSSNITPVQNVLGKNPEQIAQDLLALAIPNSVPGQVSPGSLLITLNDSKTPGIASIIAILDQYTKVNIITHPFLAVLNNQKGEISQIISQRNRGDASHGPSGSFIIGMENIDATIKLSCMPRIANKDQLSLSVGIRLETFIGNSLNKTTRGITTNSNLSNNQVLAIGGLNQTSKVNVLTKTPLLGSIPIIGNLFKGESLNVIETSVIILIKPTILMPKIHPERLELSSNYVKEKLERIEIDMQDDLLYNFTDPIIKAFIPDQDILKSRDLIADYIEETKKTIVTKDKKSKNIKDTEEPEKLDFGKIKQNLNKETSLFNRLS